MREQSTAAPREGDATPDVAGLEDQTDQSILAILLTSEFPGLWSVDELARDIGNPLAVADAVRRLHGQGLIHRLGDFVFITHAVARYETLRV
jgi:hypothetical protein